MLYLFHIRHLYICFESILLLQIKIRREGGFPSEKMKIEIDKKHISLGITSFLVIAAGICFYYLLFHGDRFSERISSLVVIASPVLYGIIFAYLLTPVVNYLEHKMLSPLFVKNGTISYKKQKGMRVLSITLTILLVILFIYAFFSILIPNIFKSIRSISYQLPYYVQNLTYWVTKFFEDNPDIEKFVLQIMDMYSGELNNYLNNSIIPQMESLLKTVSLSLISVLNFLWDFIIGVIISIYVLFSKEKFAGQAKKMAYAVFSKLTANQLIKDLRFVSNTFIGFISGKIVDSMIIGVLCFAGTSLLEMPYALLVSVIVGVTNIIPFFGPYLGAIPSAILILMVNPVKCIYFILFILFLQQLDGNVIGPKILGESTGLSGFWVIFSITIFGGLMGIPGMIIGVPFFAVIYAMVKRMVEKKLKKKNMPTSSSEYLNVERIEGDTFISLDNYKRPVFFKLSFPKREKNSEDGVSESSSSSSEKISEEKNVEK